jgi:hypothetical protein
MVVAVMGEHVEYHETIEFLDLADICGERQGRRTACGRSSPRRGCR